MLSGKAEGSWQEDPSMEYLFPPGMGLFGASFFGTAFVAQGKQPSEEVQRLAEDKEKCRAVRKGRAGTPRGGTSRQPWLRWVQRTHASYRR